MSNNAANTEVKTVVAVQENKAVELEKVTVTVIPNKEIAAILHIDCVSLLKRGFELQKNAANPYDNESQYIKDALLEASLMFVKTQAQKTIGTWDNLVTKFSKTQRYINVGRDKVQEALRDNPKTRPYYQDMLKAVEIKKALS